MVSKYFYTTHGTLGILNISLMVKEWKISVKGGKIKMNRRFNPTVFREKLMLKEIKALLLKEIKINK